MKRNRWTPEYRESLRGKAFGILTITDASKADKKNRYEVQFVCACGNSGASKFIYIKNGETVSCGCVSSFNRHQVYLVHGGASVTASRKNEYHAWKVRRREGVETLSYPDFLIKHGTAKEGEVFWLGGWTQRSVKARAGSMGYCSHIIATCSYVAAILGATKVSKMFGVNRSQAWRYTKEFPEAYAMGLAEKARRQQAEKSANLNPVRRAPANKTPDF